MDEDTLHYNAGLNLLSKGHNSVVSSGSFDDNCAIPCLWFGSSGVSIPCVANGNQRNWETATGSSLTLGLGNSSSSCITTLSGRETGGESLGELDLGLELVGNKMISNSEKNSYGAANGLKGRKPEVDLELSLSTGYAESGIIFGCGKGSSTRRNAVVPPALLSDSQLVDEGSRTSIRKCSSVITMPSLETITVVNQIHNPTHKILHSSSISTGPVKRRESLVAFTSDPVQQEQRRANLKTCRYEGCIRGGRGASGLCIAHGGGRRCQSIGCRKGAEGKTVFCKAHGGGRRCQYLGCTRSAEGRTEYCIGHGGGRRCNLEDCTRAARGNSGLCIRHGGGKRCKIENCIKSAEGISGLCISHGGGRRCQYLECTKGAQGSTLFCKAHGGGKRCAHLGCTKGAEGGTSFCKGHGGGKRCTSEGCTKSVHGGTLFCVGHGGGKRCASLGCTKSARGRTDFCVRHGGGKRCKSEGCAKSAQGSTNYCKAHGGGKRCSWGQSGYNFGGHNAVPCGRFARGKSGLCSSHAAHVQESLMQGGSAIQPLSQGMQSINTMKAISYPTNGGSSSISFRNYRNEPIYSNMPSYGISNNTNFVLGCSRLNEFSLSEGRVHGGSLMAMLRSTAASETGNSGSGGPFQHGKSSSTPHSFV